MGIAYAYFENAKKLGCILSFIFLEDYKNYRKRDIIEVNYWECSEQPSGCEICGYCDSFVECQEELIELFENKNLFNNYLKRNEN